MLLIKPVMTVGSIFKKPKDKFKTYRQQWPIKLIVKTATKVISAKHQGP